jgi:hypothetical protein
VCSENSDSHSDEYEGDCLLGCYAVWSGTERRFRSVYCSRHQGVRVRKVLILLKTGPRIDFAQDSAQ